MRAVIAAIQKNPLSAGTLFAVVIGGAIMFVTVKSDQASAAGRVVDLARRIESAEGRGVTMRENIATLREKISVIDTNIQWLVRQSGGSPAVPRELRDRADRGPQ